MTETTPERIGSYAVRGVVGSGSMGKVFLGYDPVIGRQVAIKTIHRHLLEAVGEGGGVLERFRIEAQAAGRLAHPNIVAVHQFGEDADCAYIVMEYLAGHSLREYLKRPQRFTASEVLCLMYQLLDALNYAHERGVVHRDIKPANLIVTGEGVLKITDFGIARTESSQVTRVNAVVGSPGYMAPEQYTGGTLDRRVDVFAAGVLLYQLLSGELPFAGNDEAIMYKIVYEQHQPLAERTGDPALAVFDPILANALAKDPVQRYVSALAMHDALAAVAPAGVPHLLLRDRLLEPPAVSAAQADAAVPGARSSPGSGSSSPPSTPVPTGWDEAVLASLERELAPHIGPVARVVVRRAARGQTDLSKVRNIAAQSIADLDARERFLAGGSSASPTPKRTTSTTFPPTLPYEGVPDGSLLRPEDVAKAEAALAGSLGPIAKVVARRCAAQAATREQFILRVLEQLAPSVDARKVQADLLRALLT